MTAKWHVFAKGTKTPSDMDPSSVNANIRNVREDSQTYDVLIDTENIFMWRWRFDNYVVIYIRAGATEMGKEGELDAVR